MTKPRTIAAIALAAGTFGGTVGALATAAVQSQASPRAIAAAVQRVQDSSADRSLSAINSEMRSVANDMEEVCLAEGNQAPQAFPNGPYCLK